MSVREDHGPVLLDGDAIADEGELEGAPEEEDEGIEDTTASPVETVKVMKEDNAEKDAALLAKERDSVSVDPGEEIDPVADAATEDQGDQGGGEAVEGDLQQRRGVDLGYQQVRRKLKRAVDPGRQQMRQVQLAAVVHRRLQEGRMARDGGRSANGMDGRMD